VNKYASLLEYIEEFGLLAEGKLKVVKVFGPYTRSDGRKIVIQKRDDGSSRTVSYPKWIMEEHLGRELDPDLETVDHKNFDKHDNRIENLRIVPRDEHSADDTRRVTLIKLKCSMCGKKFERSPRLLRDKSKKGNRGTFCSRQCSGKYARKRQLGQIDEFPVQPFTESKYFRRKNLKAYLNYLFNKYGDS
jgi:hypothetical protein